MNSIKNNIFQVCAALLLVSCGSGVVVGGPDCRTISKEPKEIARCLSESWQEELDKKPEVRSFLEKNKIYVSYTTSPKRLENSIFMLQAAEPFFKYVDTIYLSIPEVFKRTGEAYDLESSVFKFPKLKHLNSGKDFGPITKILPAVKLLHSQGVRDGVIVTLDDDIGFPPGRIVRAVEAVIMKGGVASSQTNCISAFGLSAEDWPGSSKCHKEDGATDIIEGWGAVAYRLNIFNDSLLKDLEKWSAVSDECFTSDDLVLSYSLAKKGIPRWKVEYPHPVVPFSFGDLEDALHNGAGTKKKEVGGLGGNGIKYKKCFETLVRL